MRQVRVLPRPRRAARRQHTQLQNLGEQPNGIAVNPLDAETIDLERWGTQGGLLSTGFDHPSTVGFGNSSNFFRPDDQIKRVISPSVPVGKAIIADWNTMILFVRESMSLMMNYWADSVFTTNAYLLRAEMRCVVGFVRPQAFALATITGA